MFKNLGNKSNEELVSLAKEGNAQAFVEIVERFKPRISFFASAYYIFGHSNEDLENECRIALYKAMDTFDASKKITFSTFSQKVMKNHMRMLLRRVSVLIETKNCVCDLDFALNVSIGNCDVCKKVINAEYIEYIKNYIIGNNPEDLLIFDAVIGNITYKELKDKLNNDNAYYRASKLISKIRNEINVDDLKN